MKKINLITTLMLIVFAMQNNLTAAEKQMQIETVRTTEAFKNEYGKKLYSFLIDKVMTRKAKYDPKAKGALDRLLANRNAKFVEYMKNFDEDKYIINFIKEYLKYVKLGNNGNIWTGNIKSKIIKSGTYSIQKSVSLTSDIRVIQNGDEKLNVPAMMLIGVFSKDKKQKEILKGKINFQIGAIIPVMVDDLGKEMTSLEKEDFKAMLSSLKAELEIVYKVTQ